MLGRDGTKKNKWTKLKKLEKRSKNKNKEYILESSVALSKNLFFIIIIIIIIYFLIFFIFS